MKITMLLPCRILLMAWLVMCTPAIAQQSPLPNILWITSEDNSAMLGCYGDAMATTPNLDQLASQGFLYTHAYANAPVCAPARNTILTGLYASSGGNQHMRSQYSAPANLAFYPQLLRQAGYYCTNNAKEDYNTSPAQTSGIWNESGKNAHYKDRKSGQPFFAVFNTMLSHESSLHTTVPAEKLRHRPDKVKLPPYHPNTPEMRHDWAQYYDKVEDMDNWVGKILDELDKSGEADNTVVFYYADHGGVLGRSKRFVYETGTRVPFIIRIPPKFKHLYPAAAPGAKVSRLVSFVDLVPTLLSLVKVPKPAYLQGHAFLGAGKTADPQYVYMFRDRMDERYDLVRAVRDSRYRYIRNYMPHRVAGQHIGYLWRAPSMASWHTAFLAGQCNTVQSAFFKPKAAEELYDTENDPWEVNNLAENPAYKGVLQRMRKANQDWIMQIDDTGFVPEGERNRMVGTQSFYDYMRSAKVPLRKILAMADKATLNVNGNNKELLAGLADTNAAVRYWAAIGLLIKKQGAKNAIPQLKAALADGSPDVAIVAAEALYHLGEKEIALSTLSKTVEHPNEFVRTHALNVIDYTQDQSKQVKEAVAGIKQEVDINNFETGYDQRMVEWLQEKWR